MAGVLRALLAKKMGMVRGTRIAARVGQFFAFILGMVGLTGAPMLIIIADSSTSRRRVRRRPEERARPDRASPRAR
jgi:Zn-dependent protease